MTRGHFRTDWLSAWTQQLLIREEINFLDLTGNTFIGLEE